MTLVNLVQQTIMFRLFLSLLFICSLAGFSSSEAGDIRTFQVHFPKGEIGTTIRGHIKGYQTIDYKLRTRAGQSMFAGLKTDNPSNYFNVMAPGETEVAFFIGSTRGNEFKGDLTESGDYTIRVYLMRNAARRNESAHYTLEVAIAAAGDVPSEADGKSVYRHAEDKNDVLVADTDFNATGNIPCARYKGQPVRSCKFGVIRRGGGSATVKVFWPDGGERNLYFENGKVTSSDDSSGGNISSEQEGDLNKIFNGSNERFEIPDAVIYSG